MDLNKEDSPLETIYVRSAGVGLRSNAVSWALRLAHCIVLLESVQIIFFRATCQILHTESSVPWGSHLANVRMDRAV